MKTQSKNEFVIVTHKNKKEVAQKLKRKEGVILIAEPGYQSYRGQVIDVCLHLYDRPTIDLKYSELSTRRGSQKICGVDWQTGWKNDRRYYLRQNPEPSPDSTWNAAREFFQHLPIEERYRLKIGFQEVVGRGLLERGKITLYIPRTVSREPAFKYALRKMIRRVNLSLQKMGQAFRFTKEHIDAMVNYMIDDLKTGKVFNENVVAGVDADIVTSSTSSQN